MMHHDTIIHRLQQPARAAANLETMAASMASLQCAARKPVAELKAAAVEPQKRLPAAGMSGSAVQLRKQPNGSMPAVPASQPGPKVVLAGKVVPATPLGRNGPVQPQRQGNVGMPAVPASQCSAKPAADAVEPQPYRHPHAGKTRTEITQSVLQKKREEAKKQRAKLEAQIQKDKARKAEQRAKLQKQAEKEKAKVKKAALKRAALEKQVRAGKIAEMELRRLGA